MRAIGFYEYGGPEVLKSIELDDPKPGAGEVIIKTKSTSVTSLDVLVRSGRGDPRITLPHVPGCDLVGEVAEIGEGVEGLGIGEMIVANTVFGCGTCKFCRKGQETMCANWKTIGMQTNGSYGELVKIPARIAIKPPEVFSVEELACMPIGVSAVWRGLHTASKAKRGSWIFIRGASGNVGIFSIMIAKQLGLKTIALTRGDRKKEQLLKLGANHVVDYNKGEKEVEKEVRSITKGNGADIVMEAFGATLNDSINLTREGGRIMLYGSVLGREANVNVVNLYRKGIKIIGIHNADKEEFTEALEFMSNHGIKPVIAKRMGIQEAAKAHELFEISESFGKIVLNY